MSSSIRFTEVDALPILGRATEALARGAHESARTMLELLMLLGLEHCVCSFLYAWALASGGRYAEASGAFSHGHSQWSALGQEERRAHESLQRAVFDLVRAEPQHTTKAMSVLALRQAETESQP